MMSRHNINIDSCRSRSNSNSPNGTALRRASAAARTSPDETVNGTMSRARIKSNRRGVFASSMMTTMMDRRRNNQGSHSDNVLFSLSTLRLVLALLIIIWFGAVLRLTSKLSTPPTSNNVISPDLQKISEKWRGIDFNAFGTIRGGNGGGASQNKTKESDIQPTASIFELSLLGNTSPKDFKLLTHYAPSCADPIDADSVSFTLVTQLSYDRIWMIPYHCKRWGDNPMSVVIFSDKDAATVMDRLVAEGCSKEHLTVQTVSRTRYDPQGTDYPVNVLRNLAFSKVKTTHLVYADIDFWPSSSLHSILNIQSVKERMASDPKLATVIPVFQMNRRCRAFTDCRDMNIPFMPKRKKGLISLMKKREASTFDPTNEGGHGSTRYISWRDQEEGSFLDLPCIKSNRYEPYLVVRYCSELPPFQEGFTGYGKNKMTWAMQLRRSGYQFSQLGEAFLVHYPHLDSKSRMEWNKKPPLLQGVDSASAGDVLESEKTGEVDILSFKRARVDALFLDFKDWMRDNVEDVARVPLCKDALNDDVRLWVHREIENETIDSFNESQRNDDTGADVNEMLAEGIGIGATAAAAEQKEMDTDAS